MPRSGPLWGAAHALDADGVLRGEEALVAVLPVHREEGRLVRGLVGLNLVPAVVHAAAELNPRRERIDHPRAGHVKGRRGEEVGVRPVPVLVGGHVFDGVGRDVQAGLHGQAPPDRGAILNRHLLDEPPEQVELQAPRGREEGLGVHAQLQPQVPAHAAVAPRGVDEHVLDAEQVVTVVVVPEGRDVVGGVVEVVPVEGLGAARPGEPIARLRLRRCGRGRRLWGTRLRGGGRCGRGRGGRRLRGRRGSSLRGRICRGRLSRHGRGREGERRDNRDEAYRAHHA
jgi:hypothetical protein